MPISLLELNTFGHAVCALITYLLWWEKPFEVDYPTTIQSQFLWELCALTWMQEHRSSAAERINHELRAAVKGDQQYQLLKGLGRVSSLHLISE